MRHSPPKTAFFRFYAELNDFLPEERDGEELPYAFRGSPSIKDAIEAQGVPHTEVELILVDGQSVDFSHPLAHNQRVAVYPMFESVDIRPLLRVRDSPLRHVRFICDAHLGALARRLRMHGFNTLYRNYYQDAQIAQISAAENRVLLTRDRRLLFRKTITHGYWLRSQQPDQQAREVLQRFQLETSVRPFRRCLRCNGLIERVDKSQIIDQLEPLTKRYYHDFYRCQDCGRIYWQGSHYERMLQKFPQTLAPPPPQE